jgi:hypothetical protein
MKIRYLFAISALLMGCASTPIPNVVTHYDQFTGYRTDLIPANLLEDQGQNREVVWLNASRVFKNRQDYDFYLEVHYEARAETGLLEISPGESLVVDADGREMKFRSSGSLNARHNRGGLVSEDAIFVADASSLRAMARAKDVKVRIIGRNGIVERDFRPENFERFKEFVRSYVDA